MKSAAPLVAIAQALKIGILCCAVTLGTPTAVHSHQKTQRPSTEQELFDTPEMAVDALVQAAERNDVPALLEIFGPSGTDIVSTGDEVADRNVRAAFVQKARKKERIVPDRSRPDRKILLIGADNWPFPVPLVKQGTKWRFDAEAGHDEIVARRIGANELDAIAVCRGYVEAQRQYASEVHDGVDPNQYAQKMISTPGRHDGLYWPNPDGSSGGPMGEVIAKAIAEGYTTSGKPFHGYYYKVLKGQGPAAPMGALDYVVQGAMIGGFALVAAPAKYGVTGIQTFIVSNDGVVYQKDLGPNTLTAFRNMDRYNPDRTWRKTGNVRMASAASRR